MSNTYILLLSILKTYRLQLSMKAATAAENICPLFPDKRRPVFNGRRKRHKGHILRAFWTALLPVPHKLHKPAGKGRLREMEKFWRRLFSLQQKL